MQHTLLPLSVREQLRHEYRIRALIVACFALSLAGAIGVGALFPTFMKALFEEKSEISALNSLKKDKDTSGVAAIEHQLASDNLIVTTLASASTPVRLSHVIQDIIALRGSLSVSSVSLNRGTTEHPVLTLSLQGVSPTRETLLAFQNRLQSYAPGTTVDLPISELARSKDIHYSLQVHTPLP